MKAICYNDPSLVLTGIKDSLRSHKLVFAAERSRINGTIETIDIWKEIIHLNYVDQNMMKYKTMIEKKYNFWKFLSSSDIMFGGQKW